MAFFRVGISTFRVAGFVISSFRVALFRLFVFSHGVFSSFRVASFRLFVFSRGVISGRKDEMAQTSHHTNSRYLVCATPPTVLCRIF